MNDQTRLQRALAALKSPITLGLLVTCAFVIAAKNYYRIRSLNDSDRVTDILYDIVEIADLKSTDLRLKFRGEKPSPAPIALLAVDNESVAQVGRWPWSREKTAHALDQLFKYGAKAVGLDMVFSEKQEDPVFKFVDHLEKDHPEIPEALKADLETKKTQFQPDAALAAVVAQYHDKIVLGAFSPTSLASSADFRPYQDYCRNEAFTRMNGKKFVKLNSTFIASDDDDSFVEVNFSAPFNAIFNDIEGSYKAKFLTEHQVSDITQLDEIASNQLQADTNEAFFKYCDIWLTEKDPYFADANLQNVYLEAFKKAPVLAGKGFEEAIQIFTKAVPSHPIPEYGDWTINIDSIQEKADFTGSFNAEQDQDGTIRKTSLFFRTGNREGTSFVPSLALQTYLISTGYQARINIGNDPKIPGQKTMYKFQIYDTSKDPEVFIGDVPVDGQGRLRINYAGPRGMFPYISAKDLFNDNPKMTIEQVKYDAQNKRWALAHEEVNKADFIKDKTFIFGATATGIYDLRVTPFDKDFPGTETHVNAIANLMDRNFLRVSDQEPKWMIWVLLGLGICFSVLISKLGALSGFISTLLAFVALFVGDWMLFTQGWITTIVLPLFLLLTLFIILTFYKYFTEERLKNELRATFSKYVSPAIVDEILRDPKNIELGGLKIRMSVFFSDVRNFTTISEKLDPQHLSDLLNEYLTPMTNIIFENKGTLDKYMGDAIMAFFGAPVVYPDHAAHACRAALQSIEQLQKLQTAFASRDLPLIDIGIGINTAEMSVGNMGSQIVRNYTVMGDAVNLGSRLEGINKEYGTRIIISEFTEKDIHGQFTTREIDRVRVKGKKEPVRIFELVCEGPPAEAVSVGLDTFLLGYKLYTEGKFSDALEKFELCAQILPDDGPSLVYIERCTEYKKNPPGPEWDGVYVMTKK